MTAIRHILIVDDNEAEHFLYKHAIRKFDPGIKVDCCYDGVEALDMIDRAETLPDCILVDFNMPRMGGVEFLSEFQPRHGDKGIVVVMLTSSVHDRDREAAMSHDCLSGFFTKPLDRDDLEKLRTLVAAARGADED